MEKYTGSQVLEKLLLPLNTAWEISEVVTDEVNENIYVKLRYRFDSVEDDGKRYSIYDYRKERQWRHT